MDMSVQPSSAAAEESNGKGPQPFSSYLRVFKYNDTLGWVMNTGAVICMIAAGTLLPLMDVVFGKFVTVFNDFALGVLSPEGYRKEVTKYTLYFIYLFVAKFVLGYIWLVLISMSAIRTTKNLRIAFLRQTLRQEIGYFDSAEAGSITGHVTTNCNLVNQGISEKLGLTVQAISTFVTAFIVAFVVQWKLTLITICVVPAILIVTCICVIIDTKQETQIMDIYAQAGRLSEEIISSIRNVHAFWAFEKLSTKYGQLLNAAGIIGKKKSPNYAVLFSIEFFCIFAGYGLAFWQGIKMYHSGEIKEPGNIVTVIFAIIVAAQALTTIAPQMITLSKATAAAQSLFEVIDRDSKIDALSNNGAVAVSCEGNIELENIDFSYPSRPGVQILKKLSLSIPAKRVTAIVGASGSGKSTIVGLIERWFSPVAGSIRLDGRQLDEYNLKWLRTNVRLVQQEPVLFRGTIFVNVANGLAGTAAMELPEDEKRSMVVEACRAAYAHDFIEKLPNGYDTMIGERGAMLSGGQKQRIAIARSIISNPKVLLLDEATSALDPSAEQIVQQALNNVSVGRTMVVIAHRLSTIRDADNIVVMSSGTIVEQGTHQALIDSNGAYARLVRAQDLGNGEDDKMHSDDSSSDKADVQLEKTKSVPRGDGVDDETSHDGPATKQVPLWRCLAMIIAEHRSLWLPFGVIVVAGGLAGATYPALAIVFSHTMEAFSLSGQAIVDRGNFYSLMFFVIALGNLLFYAILGWYCNIVAQIVVKEYRLELFKLILKQNISYFDKPHNSTGALASRLSTEPTHLQDLLSMNIGLLLVIVINLFSSCILAIAYGWKLGLVLSLGAIPPLVFAGYVRIRLESKLDDDTSHRFADSAGIASEAVLAIRTVASLALERDIIDSYQQSLNNIAKYAVASVGWTMFWYALSQSISFLAMALGFWYGGRLVSGGEYTPTQFYVVFIATIFSGEAAAQFFTYTTSITKATNAANHLFDLRKTVALEMENHSGDSLEKPRDGGPELSCEKLEFSYPQRPNIKVLKGVSLDVRPGQFVAFVGASGCGKTTMIGLLERFYNPTNGSLCYDGTAVDEIALDKYRSEIALVQQDPVLYQGSVRENILMGLDDKKLQEGVPDEEVLEACHQANIETFMVSLPDGLGTSCGSQGLQFSGGQRQRIAIARALIRKPRLLLLDEATSSLDTESERIVQQALDAAAKGEARPGDEGEAARLRTTVAVAHRLSTIKGADKIFVFSEGRIVESGNHEELLSRRGMYYDMCRGQSLDKAV